MTKTIEKLSKEIEKSAAHTFSAPRDAHLIIEDQVKRGIELVVTPRGGPQAEAARSEEDADQSDQLYKVQGEDLVD